MVPIELRGGVEDGNASTWPIWLFGIRQQDTLDPTTIYPAKYWVI